MRRWTLYLISIMIVAFTLQTVDNSITENFMLVSSDIASRPWTLVTSIFLHGDLLHLLYNGFGLAIFGLILENAIGTKKFVALFFASGIISGIVASFFYESTLGASGAIFGIIGSLAVLRPLTVVWVAYLPMPMFLAAAVWAAGDLIGMVVPSNIANAAHLVGMGIGVIAGFMLRGKTPKKVKREKKEIPKAEIEKWEQDYMLDQQFK